MCNAPWDMFEFKLWDFEGNDCKNFAKHQQERILESDPRTKETSNKVKYQSMNDR
jgi:hypothetical protein